VEVVEMTVPVMAAVPHTYTREERKLYAIVRRPRPEEARAGLIAVLVGLFVCVVGQDVLQEDGLGLEDLIAACEAQQGCKGIAGSEQCDYEYREYRLAEFELWVLHIKPRQDQVAVGRSISII
jgi:hypothetical protein